LVLTSAFFLLYYQAKNDGRNSRYKGQIAGNKKPRFLGEALGFTITATAPARAGLGASGNQCLAGTLDHGLQRFRAGILIGVQALAVTSNTVFVDDGEAEAAFARSHDQAVHGSKSIGERADSILSLDMSSHVGVFPKTTRDKSVQK
jgi:hypothetical protein